MARPKKAQKVKDSVRICQLKLANENMSLYLDVYVKGVRKVESLGLYLIGLLDFIKNTYYNTKSPDNPRDMSLHMLHLHQSTMVRMLNVAVKDGVMDRKGCQFPYQPPLDGYAVIGSRGRLIYGGKIARTYQHKLYTSLCRCGNGNEDCSGKPDFGVFLSVIQSFDCK